LSIGALPFRTASVKDTVDEKVVVLGLRGGGDCLWEEGLGGGVEEEEVVPWG
jgi:hypothetical protein